MWHASVSITRKGEPVDDQARVERLAVAALRGVGGDSEWWVYGLHLYPQGHPYIGHLRVPVTPAEYLLVPPGCVIGDAGETGPQRPRTL